MPETLRLLSRRERARILGGFVTAEDVRDFFKDDRKRIAAVIAAVREGACPCCGIRPNEGIPIILLECGHPMCEAFCNKQNHECIPCALAT